MKDYKEKHAYHELMIKMISVLRKQILILSWLHDFDEFMVFLKLSDHQYDLVSDFMVSAE